MSEKKLLFSITRKDFDVQYFRCGGHGGQKVNKTSSGCRIVHRDSGAVGESTTSRHQHENKKLALERLVASPKFKVWHSRMCFELSVGKTLEEIVDEEMNEKNLKIETKKNGKWEVCKGDI
jgi:hypothetical protein